jgi:orotidine-5'-phosphate decarboxylase
VWERVARIVDEIGRPHTGASGYSCVGAVVGATVPRDVVARLRELMPRAIFLMPGLGAQGGDTASVKAALDARGLGVLAPSSRGLAYPWRGKGDGAFTAPDDWRSRIAAAIDSLDRDLAKARA